MLLTLQNYAKGFLVDEETIAGVTQMGDAGDPIFAAYVSHSLTGETLAFQEFDSADKALEFLAAIDRPWVYEGVGCSSKTSAPQTGCGTGGCSGCAT